MGFCQTNLSASAAMRTATALLLLVSAAPACLALQIAPRITSLRASHLRAPSPRCQFGKKPDTEPRGLTRDNEPEEFFKTNMDDMTDEEKLKSPTVIIGLAILVLPFFAGIIALNVYK